VTIAALICQMTRLALIGTMNTWGSHTQTMPAPITAGSCIRRMKLVGAVGLAVPKLVVVSVVTAAVSALSVAWPSVPVSVPVPTAAGRPSPTSPATAVVANTPISRITAREPAAVTTVAIMPAAAVVVRWSPTS
jgi:hypothetical protein